MKTAVYNKIKKLFAAGYSTSKEAKEAGKLRKKVGRKENQRRHLAKINKVKNETINV